MSKKVTRFFHTAGIITWVSIALLAVIHLYIIMPTWFKGFSVGIIIGGSVGVVVAATIYMASGGEEFCDRGKR